MLMFSLLPFLIISNFIIVHTKKPKMNEHQTMLSLTTTIIINLFFFFFLHQTTSLSSNCMNTTFFNCATLSNISYPFTCGPPQFNLTCYDGVPELTISSLSYRVLQLDPLTRTLTLARLDLWNKTCTNVYLNSVFDTNYFSYGSGNQNLTLSYWCSHYTSLTTTPANLFECESNGNKSDSYSLVGPLPLDPVLSVVQCDFMVEVQILEKEAERLIDDRSLLREVLMNGFHVNYRNPYENECLDCVGYGGICGFDYDYNVPVCVCGDRLCPSSGKSKSKAPVAIGVTAGAVGLIAILGFVFFMVKRKKRIATAKQSRSDDLFTPPSSNGAFTSTTNMSQSVPSYTSSKTDTVPPMRSFYFGVQVFTIAELEEATDNFDPSRELGEGGFGTVYKGKLKDGRVVAVKRHYESNFKRVQQFMNEVEILARLRHKNLVTLFGCTSRHSRELLLVYEFISNGTVADHLHGNRVNSNFISWPVRLNIAIETAEALAYLHASDVIHRDVKSNNILLDENFRVKVADFGLSRLFPNDATHVSTAPQGTPGYVDPEYYQCYQLTDKSDVYSFGVVLIELISSLQAVDVKRHRNDVNLANMAINKIQNQEVHDLVDPCLGYDKDYDIRKMTTGVAELAFRCLQQQRDMRPSMDEVLEVLRGIKSDDPGAKEAKVVNVRTEEVVLLNNVPYPLSSTDSFDDKWVRGSSTSNSS